MSYERHTEKRTDYLLVRYTGSLVVKDLPREGNVFQAVADLCEENECEKALLDARELTTDLGVLDLFQLASQLARVSGGTIRFALLGTEEQVPPDKFFENVSVNRGGLVRVFIAEDEAIA